MEKSASQLLGMKLKAVSRDDSVAWLERMSHDSSSLKKFHMTSVQDSMARTSKGVALGETVASIPESLWITREGVVEDCLGPYVNDIDTWVALSLFLIHENEAKETQWADVVAAWMEYPPSHQSCGRMMICLVARDSDRRVCAHGSWSSHGENLALVPGIDCLVHRRQGNSELSIQSGGLFSGEKSLVVKAIKAIGQGEEVSCDYHQASQRAMDYRHPLNLYWKVAPPPETMLAMLRLINLDNADAFLLESIFRNEVWGHVNLPVSEENERAVYESMISGCAAVLQTYPTKIDDDIALLNRMEGMSNEKAAVSLRLKEKEVLRLRCASLKTEWDYDEDRRKERKERALAKKVEKHLRKHGPQDMPTGYTDEDNPFGDSRVNERFVWGKKIEKDIARGATVKDFTASAHSKRHYERMNEIEKIQKRREQRERERAAMAEELELVQRERARAEAVEPKAIDIITNNLFLLDGFDQTAQDPNTFISGLTLFQLEELLDHIKEYSELDASNREHDEFWRALADVTRHTLLGARRQEEIDKAQLKGLPVPEDVRHREAGWHPSLESDIAGMLDGKTLGELESLESGILAELDSGNAADPDYWSSVLRRLDLYKSKAILREFHMSLMEKGLEKLRHGAPRAAWEDLSELLKQGLKRKKPP
eukprot:jgi/Picre1/31039/NNA_006396.t1